MGKVFGSSCLIAGTAIGAGMLALPMVLIKIGLQEAVVLMIAIWGLAYYSALLGSELNLRAAIPLSIGGLARRFSGPKAEWVGQISLLLLCYALLSSYLNGCSSVLASLWQGIAPLTALGAQDLLLIITMIIGCLLLVPLQWVDSINRLLFAGMLLILLISCGALTSFINLNGEISLVFQPGQSLAIIQAIPIVFTSFGFQIIFHTISKYLEMDASKIKRSFFYGSLMPALVYISWTVISLVFIACHQPELFLQLKEHPRDVGDFINILSQAASLPGLKLLSWGLAVLAILTSAIGVGLGLSHTWQNLIKSRFWSMALTIIPPYLVVQQTPHVFIRALGFAGMILVVLALLLPLYLLYRSDATTKSHYKILDNRLIRILVIIISLGIILIEILNLIECL